MPSIFRNIRTEDDEEDKKKSFTERLQSERETSANSSGSRAKPVNEIPRSTTSPTPRRKYVNELPTVSTRSLGNNFYEDAWAHQQATNGRLGSLRSAARAAAEEAARARETAERQVYPQVIPGYNIMTDAGREMAAADLRKQANLYTKYSPFVKSPGEINDQIAFNAAWNRANAPVTPKKAEPVQTDFSGMSVPKDLRNPFAEEETDDGRNPLLAGPKFDQTPSETPTVGGFTLDRQPLQNAIRNSNAGTIYDRDDVTLKKTEPEPEPEEQDPQQKLFNMTLAAAQARDYNYGNTRDLYDYERLTDPNGSDIPRSDNRETDQILQLAFGYNDPAVTSAFNNETVDPYIKRTLSYLYNTGQTEKLDEYAATLNQVRERRRTELDYEHTRELTEQFPVAMNVYSVLASPLRGLSYIGQAFDFIEDGKINENAGYQTFARTPDTIRNVTSERIRKEGLAFDAMGTGQFQAMANKITGNGDVDPNVVAYQTVMSMADFLWTALVTGNFAAGAENAARSEAGKKASEWLSLSIMGSGAAASTTLEAKERGLSDGQAFALGTVSGLAEVVTEKVSLETLLNPDYSKGEIVYILKNALAEGSEEIASDLINNLADFLIAADKSQLMEEVRRIMAETGCSESEALGRAIGRQGRDALISGIGGAASGGIMAGGGTILQNARYNAATPNVLSEAEIADLVSRDLGITRQEYNTLRDAAVGLAEESNPDVNRVVAKIATNNSSFGGTISEQARDTIERNYNDSQRDASEYVQDMETAYFAGVGGEDTIADLVKDRIVSEDTPIEALQEVYRDGRKQAQVNRIQASEEGRAMGRTGIQSSDEIMTFREAVDWAEQNNAVTDEMRDALKTGQIEVYSVGDLKNGTAVFLDEAQAQDYAETRGGKVVSATVPTNDIAWSDYNYGQYTGDNYVREDAARGIEGRLDGEGAGVTVRGVEDRTGRFAGAAERSGIYETRQELQKSAKRKISAASLIENGSTNSSVTEIEYKAKGMPDDVNRAASLLMRAGFREENIHFYVGDLRGKDNMRVQGFTDGEHVWVQADNNRYTAEQIAGHEAMHRLIQNGSVSIESVRSWMRTNAPEATSLIEAIYQRSYKGLNGIDLWEEAICDAAGGINIHAARYNFMQGLLRSAMPSLQTAIEQTSGKTVEEIQGGEVRTEIRERHSDEALDDAHMPAQDEETVKQEITSAGTSIKQIPALFTDSRVRFGKTNIDIGGGRFDLATNYLAERGTTNMVFDPYNRDADTNQKVIDYLQSGKKADTATCANVLNVIAEKAARANVILEVAKSIKDDGTAYFMVYEGDGSGVGKVTKAGYQNNLKTAEYVSEISEYFDDVRRQGKLITAKDPKANLPQAMWEVEPGRGIRYSAEASEGRGYIGKSMSVNAAREYADGSMPLSRWTKSAISEAVAEVNPAIDISDLTRQEMVDTFLQYKAWHHTGAFYNVTPFYSLRNVSDIKQSDIDDIVSNRQKTEKTEAQRIAENENRANVERAKEALARYEVIFNSGITGLKTLNGVMNRIPLNDLDEQYEKALIAIRNKDFGKVSQWESLPDGHWRRETARLFKTNFTQYVRDNYAGKLTTRTGEYKRVKNMVVQYENSDIRDSAEASESIQREGAEVVGGETVVKTSLESWGTTDKTKLLNSLKKAGFAEDVAQAWIDDVNTVSAIIAADRERLDYDAADNQVMLKNNSEYVKTLDASTLCAKRLLYQGTFNRITELLPNSVLTPDDLIRVRQIMAERNDEVPCGICYVESRRKTLSKFAGQWLNEVYKGDVKVNMNDLTSTDGLERLRKTHPDVYDQYTKWMRGRGTANPKVVELRTAYRNDISKLTAGQIEKITRIGGLRVQSFSDFETVHLIDMMQAVLDMSAKKLTAQAYTKVPNFAWAFGDTGIKINLSLIGKAVNGKLVFDSKEGMNIDDAMKLRDRYSENVGTILVGANDESIRLAMADDRIDFIIPFHRSGWSGAQFEALGLTGYDDYQDYQNERHLDGTSIKEGNLYPIDYWDYSLTGKENAERYLEICKEQKRIPKFEQFLKDNGDGSWSLPEDGSADGYWKTLIDFKMYNNQGIGAPQRAVTANVNMEEAQRILNEYDGRGNRSLPVDEEAAKQFADEYKANHKDATKFSKEADSEGRSLSKQQAEYFKDSKIRDEDGNLQVVYHGTDADFTVFDRTKGRSTMDIQGSFFSPWDIDAAGYGSNVQAYYLNIKNPAPESVAYAALNRFKGQNNAGIKAREYLESRGYDGVNNGNEEYIAFYPEQIKKVGNASPTSNADVRYSMEAEDQGSDGYSELTDTISELRAELKKQTARAEHFKAETRLSQNRGQIDEASAEKFTRSILKAYESKADFDTTKAGVTEYANWMRKTFNELRTVDDAVRWADFEDEAYTRAVDLMRPVVLNTETLLNEDAVEIGKDIRSYLKSGRGISISDADQRSIYTLGYDNFNDFRRRNFGNLKITKDGPRVDQVWSELQDQFGKDFFPDDIYNSLEQLERINEVLSELEPIYGNPFVSNAFNAEEAVDYAARDVVSRVLRGEVKEVAPTFSDKMHDRIDAAQKEAVRRVQEVRQEARAKTEEKLNALKNHYAEMNKNRSTLSQMSKERQRLLKIARRLMNRKMPAVNKAWVEETIGNLDLAATSITGRKIMNLMDLSDWYEEQKQNPDFIPMPQIEKQLQRLVKRQMGSARDAFNAQKAGLGFDGMTQEEVLDLTEALLNFEHQLDTRDKLINSEDRRSVYAMTLEVLTDIENSRGINIGRDSKLYMGVRNYAVDENLNPRSTFRRIAGYNENDPLYQRYVELNEGQHAMMTYEMNALGEFDEWMNDKEFQRDHAGRHAKTVTATFGGKEVTMTRDVLISLYMHSLNDQNMRHIARSGIDIPDAQMIRKNNLQRAYEKTTRVRIQPSEMKAFFQNEGKLTDKEMSFIRAMQKYFAETSQKELNRVSLDLYGFERANEENYWPIEVNTNFLRQDANALFKLATTTGEITMDPGFLQERKVESGEVIIGRGALDVLQSAIHKNANFIGMAIPIRNFSKLYSTKSVSFEELPSFRGQAFAAIDQGSVRDLIQKKWGEQANKYIVKLMNDMQGLRVKDEGRIVQTLRMFRSNYAGAVLTFNLSVALKQTASYPTAAAVIGWRPLLQAFKLTYNEVDRVDLDLIKKYTPLLDYRRKGFTDSERGEMAQRNIHVPAALNWIQGMDLLTTQKLWRACEYYVQDNFKALERRSDPYYRKVAEIYNRVIEETQPNYTTMQRPGNLRGDFITTSLNMFKTQPYQNFNILYDAFGNFAAKRRALKTATDENIAQAKEDFKQARTHLWNSVSSIAVSTIVFAVATFAWALGRRKKKLEDAGKEMAKSMVSSLIGMVPLLNIPLDLISAHVFDEKYWGYETVTAGSINDFTNGVDKIITAREDGKEVKVKDVANLAFSISQLFGLPLSNVVNLLNIGFAWAGLGSLQDFIQDGIAPSDANYVWEQRRRAGVTTKQIAEACGVQESTVRGWQSGKIPNMKKESKEKLAGLLGISVNELNREIELSKGDD